MGFGILGAVTNEPIYVDEEGNEIAALDVARDRIDVVAILEKLQSHMLDTPCLDMTQIAAAQVLLKQLSERPDVPVQPLSVEVRFVAAGQPAAPDSDRLRLQ